MAVRLYTSGIPFMCLHRIGIEPKTLKIPHADFAVVAQIRLRVAPVFPSGNGLSVEV